eukprot:scaffold17766_cov71-Skeletonema_marinoi.AAC.2
MSAKAKPPHNTVTNVTFMLLLNSKALATPIGTLKANINKATMASAIPSIIGRKVIPMAAAASFAA